MLESPTFRSTGLPVIVTLITIVLFNLGLYTRLGAQPKVDQLALPYSEDFSQLSDNPYEEFGGDWEIRDEKLIQMDTTGFDLTSFMPLTIPENTSYAFATTLQYFGGSMGGGLMFNAQQTTSRQKSHMVRFNVDNDQLWLIYGYFGDDSNFVGQGSAQLETMPTDDTPQRLALIVKTDTYDILLNDELITQDVPLNYSGGAVGFIAAASQIGFDDVEVAEIVVTDDGTDDDETTPEPVVSDATPQSIDQPEAGYIEFLTQELYRETFEARGVGEVRWRPINGNWTYEDNALIQTQTELYDLSNIYQNPVTYPMTYLIKLRHLDGVGGGLLFNLRLPNTTENAYMVRYISDADVVAWGYFDETGAFNGVGSVSVPPAGDTQHTIGVAVSDNTFDVLLDGERIARDIPLHEVVSPSFVGLTASQSMVAFDSVDIFGEVTQIQTSSTTTANIDSSAAIGTWNIEQGVIMQMDTEATDYIAGTGLAGEQFTVSVKIQFDNDLDDAGAGIIFHMAERDNPISGYLVRFANQGQSIFWGQFDDSRIFSGLGDADLNNDGLTSATLTVIVKQSTFDILVDDEIVTENIPLARNSGWIGLVSFRGPVTFSNLNILLGEQ